MFGARIRIDILFSQALQEHLAIFVRNTFYSRKMQESIAITMDFLTLQNS